MIVIESNDDADAAAYSILVAQGFKLRREIHPDNGIEFDVATSKSSEYWGISPVDILGLIAMREARGDEWRPSRTENRSFGQYDKAYERIAETELVSNVTARIFVPQNLTRTISIFVTSALRTFSMIAFAAIYLKEYLIAQSPLSLLIFPLTLYGIWMSINALDRFLDFCLSKLFQPISDTFE